MVRNLSFILRAAKGFQGGGLTSSGYESSRLALLYGEWAGWQRDKEGVTQETAAADQWRMTTATTQRVSWEWRDMDKFDRNAESESDRPGNCADVGEWRRWRSPALFQLYLPQFSLHSWAKEHWWVCNFILEILMKNFVFFSWIICWCKLPEVKRLGGKYEYFIVLDFFFLTSCQRVVLIYLATRSGFFFALNWVSFTPALPTFLHYFTPILQNRISNWF